MVHLEELILKAHELSPLPASVTELARLASLPDTDLDQIVEVMAYDQALTLRLLRAANAAASAGTTRVLLAREAIFRLGTARVLALAIASSVHPVLRRNVEAYGLAEGDLWRHSIAAAAAAETIAEFASYEVPPESFTAALLHDVGKLVMGRFLGAEHLDLIRRAQSEGGLDPLTAERQLLKVHHGELGGVIAQHWGLPERIVRGIIYHHDPGEGRAAVCDVTYLANLLAKHIQKKEAVKPENSGLVASEDALERLGIAGSDLPRLLARAQSQFETVSARFNAV
jgi:putative nucleotidyltransferase with HDIG domain